MKHSLPVTAILVLVFLLIQFFGLYALSETMTISVSKEGAVDILYDDTAVGARPEMEGATSLIYILFGILVGTGIVLLFMRFGQIKLWKVMYFLAIWLASSITLGVFIGSSLAMLIALALAMLELYRTNIFIHNVTELLIYPGIAILFAPLFSIFWAAVLLLAISAYDMFAVWKSGHMVTLAKFQTGTKAFAGFVIPYGREKGLRGIKKKIPKGVKEGGMRTAILGGGDIAFPLVFAGVAMEWLITTVNVNKLPALLETSVIPVFAAIALLVLFLRAEKDKFYPAMPFITAGCFIGFAVLWALNTPFL
jgi:presenilin-like A22 family membrane protease